MKVDLRRFVVLSVLMLACSSSNAACSQSLIAIPHSSGISISDGGCEFSEEMIFNGLRGHSSSTSVSKVPFSSQCKWTETGFVCMREGNTVLAGTVYAKVPGPKKVCGNSKWPIYRCMTGCDKHGTPKVFEIEPYEC